MYFRISAVTCAAIWLSGCSNDSRDHDDEASSELLAAPQFSHLGLLSKGVPVESGRPVPPIEAKESACPFDGVTKDKEFYESKAKAFIGLNPKDGEGSGFFRVRDDMLGGGESWGEAPDSNTGRVDLCTCDCKASPSSLGCVGWGGIGFRYISSLVAKGVDGDCAGKPWEGQMVCQDCGREGCNTTDEDQNFRGYIGEDSRQSPGGRATYSVHGVLQTTGDAFAGVFRQPNDVVRCSAGLQDKADYEAGNKEVYQSCFAKCGDKGMYADWLAYCTAASEDATSGFSGYGI